MTEEIPYEVVRTLGDVEVRAYPRTILAEVRGRSDGEAFGLLFRYITGANRSRQEIPMTAPVVSSRSGPEKIAMTAPVVSGRESFSFVLPRSYSMETAPVPADERVRLVELPERRMAVIRFRGYTRAARVRSKAEELLATLRQNRIAPAGEPVLMRYNPPYTPGFLRRNEVGVEVQA